MIWSRPSISGRACLRTLLVIPSGPGALLGAVLCTARLICSTVISVLHCGRRDDGLSWSFFSHMSWRFACGGFGKKFFCSSSLNCSNVSACPSSVGMVFCVVPAVRYFLSCQMVLLLAVCTKFRHELSLALEIAWVYSLSLSLHALWSPSRLVLFHLFLRLFCCRQSFVSSGVHHLLVCLAGFLSGVDAFSACWIAPVSVCTASSIAWVLWGGSGSFCARHALSSCVNFSQSVLLMSSRGSSGLLTSVRAKTVSTGRWSAP